MRDSASPNPGQHGKVLTMELDGIKVLRTIEWILVAAVLVLAGVAWYKMDDSYVAAMLCGVASLAIVLVLVIITHYLEKHS